MTEFARRVIRVVLTVLMAVSLLSYLAPVSAHSGDDMAGMNMSSTPAASADQVANATIILKLVDGASPTDFQIVNLTPEVMPSAGQVVRVVLINEGTVAHLIVVHPDGNEDGAIATQQVHLDGSEDSGQQSQLIPPGIGGVVNLKLTFPATGMWMVMCHSGGPGHDQMMVMIMVM